MFIINVRLAHLNFSDYFFSRTTNRYGNVAFSHNYTIKEHILKDGWLSSVLFQVIN